jgi:hypothetical protein
VNRPRVGTTADTPHTLRMKAKEFLRLAETAGDDADSRELTQLAGAYLSRAAEVERESAAGRPTAGALPVRSR